MKGGVYRMLTPVVGFREPLVEHSFLFRALVCHSLIIFCYTSPTLVGILISCAFFQFVFRRSPARLAVKKYAHASA